MNIEVFRANLDRHRDDILGFWQSNFTGWSEDKYTQFYLNDPYGVASCWLARETDNNDIVGTVAVFPKLMFVGGKEVLCGIAGDLGVSRKYRQHGIANSLQSKMMDDYSKLGFAYIYVTPNVLSEKVAITAGYEIVGRTVRTIKILKTVEYINRFVRIKPLSRLLSLPIDFFLMLKSLEQHYQYSDHYDSESMERFDERFDRLWERAASAY